MCGLKLETLPHFTHSAETTFVSFLFTETKSKSSKLLIPCMYGNNKGKFPFSVSVGQVDSLIVFPHSLCTVVITVEHNFSDRSHPHTHKGRHCDFVFTKRLATKE